VIDSVAALALAGNASAPNVSAATASLLLRERTAVPLSWFPAKRAYPTNRPPP
jgi:hypothetical protein